MRFLKVLLVLSLLGLFLVPGSTGQNQAAAQTPVSKIWTFGDSITQGTGVAASESWPAQLDDLIGPGQQVWNYGIGGQGVAYDTGSGRMDEMVQNYLVMNPNNLPEVIIFMGGINDMIRSSDVGVGNTRWAVANLDSWIRTYFPQVKFYVATITPYRSDSGYAVELSERRANYNTWARQAFNPTDRLMDTGDILTAGSTFADIRYYMDSLHPNARGYSAIADGMYTMLSQRGLA